jgi:2'-5' RNA ligase
MEFMMDCDENLSCCCPFRGYGQGHPFFTSRLRQVWKGVRWVIPQHFHITLVFLGEREDEIVDEISGVVGPVIAGFPCFNIQFDGIGCFGSPSFPRLIYERIGDGADHLVALNRSLQAAWKI